MAEVLQKDRRNPQKNPKLIIIEDEVGALVLDPGYSTIRAGFAGEDIPKSIVPSYYGVHTPPGGSSRLLFGENALHDPKPYVEVRNALAGSGAEDWVADWDVASKLWEHSITSRLTGERSSSIRNGNGQNGEEDGDVNMDDADESESPMVLHPLLMTEPGKTTLKSRERAIEIAMESWDVPAFYLGKTGVLAA
jgi:actin-related protein 4